MCENEMAKEQEFLKLISRVTMSEEDKSAISRIVDEDLNWFYILAQSFKHKVTGLIYMNMKELNLMGRMPRAVYEPMSFYSYASSERYNRMKQEISLVTAELVKKNILYVPLKGAFLIPDIYQDGRKRISNDVDFLVRKKDTPTVINIMQDLGFVMGEIDSKTKQLVEYSREKTILWLSSMDNLPAFYKKVDSPYLDYMIFDFRHSMNHDAGVVNEIFERFTDGTPDCIDFFLHLCYHAYEEAGQYTAHTMLKELTLMKFCDMREYGLKYIANKCQDELIVRAKESKLERALLFCMTALNLIYHDDFETDIISKLDFHDDSILETYGEKEFGEQLTFTHKFEERLFSFNNLKEIMDKPDWVSL